MELFNEDAIHQANYCAQRSHGNTSATSCYAMLTRAFSCSRRSRSGSLPTM